MPFFCPHCSTPGSLEITRSIHLPADSRSDEIIVQVVRCSWCAFQGIAVYEESRRGALDSDSWDHTGYRIDRSELDMLLETFEICSQPANPGCECAAHRSLGRQDPQGRWIGLDGFRLLDSFTMDR